MADGSLKRAGDLSPGDSVRTMHEYTKEWGNHMVSYVAVVMSERLALSLGGVDFFCSKTHRFYDEGRWIEASSLKVGKRLDGLLITDVSEFDYGEVVSITVADAHTYVCGGLLCHNKSRLPAADQFSLFSCLWRPKRRTRPQRALWREEQAR